MRITTGIVPTVTLALALVPGGAGAAPLPGPAPGIEVSAPSKDALIARLLEALHAKDAAALRRLRVTEAEYRGVILAGSVGEGEPLRSWPEEATGFAWGLLDAKSAYYERWLLGEFGGRRWEVKAVGWEKGTRRYATYHAHRQLRLLLVDAAGRERELRTGSVAEVPGGCKFISFVRD